MLKKHSKTVRISLVGIGLCILIAGGLGMYHYLNRPPVIKPTAIQTNQGDQTKKPAPTSPAESTGQATTSTTGSSTSSPAAASSPTTAPTAPSGSFVSNHKPNLSGQPAPNTEESTCVVAQGVSCNISFTNGTKTVTLGAQKAGTSGVVAWRWSLQGAGITEGSWTITATATLNNQNATTTDPLPLQVQP